MKRSVFSGRRARLALLAGIASLAMAGCTEESFNGITLYAENHTNGTKTVVDGTNIAWADGDKVDINGTPYTISNANTSAQLTGVKAVVGDDLYALYPAGIGTRTDNTLALNLPSSYTYQKDASGKQIIAFPMVAKGTMVEENGELRFKHLCAAIDVKVKNPASNPNTLHLNSITLTSATGQISGARTVTISDWSNPTIAPDVTDDESAKSVTLVFSNDVALEPGDEAQFQLPIYPLASGQDLTFTIEANRSTIEGVMVTDIVHNTKTVTLTAEIPRAQVAFTPAISLDDATTVTPTSFSVSETDKIYFSAGNLNHGTSVNEWSFIVDLDSYELNNGHIKNKKYDEGGGFCFPFSFISNGRINGFDQTWRVLTRDEWTYLLYTRKTGVTIADVEDANAIFCKINNRKGLLVIPDNFVMPVTTVEWEAESINQYRRKNSTSLSVTYTPLTTADWKTLEAAGCIFLPQCGWTGNSNTSGDGYYWSSDENKSDTTRAYGIHFNSGGLNLYGVREANASGSIWEKRKSNFIAIRVVTDAQ